MSEVDFVPPARCEWVARIEIVCRFSRPDLLVRKEQKPRSSRAGDEIAYSGKGPPKKQFNVHFMSEVRRSAFAAASASGLNLLQAGHVALASDSAIRRVNVYTIRLADVIR